MDVIRERLANQCLTGPRLRGPVDVVRKQGAVQAQDYPGAMWAIGMRTMKSTHAEVERAIARGDILRTHVLRPTWHFVLPEDIRWMLALTGPRIAKAMSSYNKRMGLTPAVFRRSNAVIERALRDGAHLTRTELGEILRRERILEAGGTRLAHLMMHAELNGIVCSGARRGKSFTYSLLELRARRAAQVDPDDALSRLAERYFTSHGPATVHDFAWWSGLTVSDAKRAVEICGKALTQMDNTPLWMVERESPPEPSAHTARLLPNYDEYFIGHRDRSAIGGRLGSVGLVTGGDARIGHVIMIGGHLAGSWRRIEAGSGFTAATKLLTRLMTGERRNLDDAVARFEQFWS
jgi:hypothetical protein